MKEYLYGICKYYQDDKGYFNYDPDNKCPDCGHIINNDRIANAKYLGIVCC